MFPHQNRRPTGLRIINRCAGMTGVLLCLLIFTCGSCYAQDATAQISAAAAGLEKTISSLNLSDEEAGQLMSEIRRARSSLAAGHLYLSLYVLQFSWVELTTRNYMAGKTAIEKGGVTAFEQEWQRLGLELSEKEKLLKLSHSRRLPTVVQALAESSQIQIRPYYQSGRLYGLNTTIPSGLYYLGRARANLDFALFCQRLQFAQLKPSIKLRSLKPELAQIEAETLQSYRSADASSQPQYNRLNSNLKVASELNTAAMYEGALHEYLRSSLFLGLINKPAVNAEELSRLKTQSKTFERQLMAGKVDHSIGLLYWQLAERILNPAGAAKPDENELKRAAVIMDKVLPLYFKYAMETER